MSTIVRIEDRLFEALESLGNVEHAVQTALRRYTVEQILGQISELQAEDKRWQEKYGCDYATFVEKMATDKAFHRNVEQRLNPMWEEDLIHWEFCHEGVRDWRSHLEALFSD